MFHDGLLIPDVGFSILKLCIVLDFWILDFGFFDFMYKIPYPLCGLPQGFFFWIKNPYPLCGLPQGLFFLEELPHHVKQFKNIHLLYIYIYIYILVVHVLLLGTTLALHILFNVQSLSGKLEISITT